MPEFQFVMLDGALEAGVKPGDSPAFQEATEALYGISYTLKFMLKQRKDDPIDYPVMALEGLWWVENGVFDINDPSNWLWTLMILQPDVISPALFEEGLAALRKKRGDQPAFARLRLEPFREGWCVQMMHVGPYATEPETIARMEAFASETGWTMSGRHHEIYLGDPRRADPAKLKTILRHQVQK
ncbi:MAG TPA: GyrI-like domain-containing protein [Anaerolineaceae bacterium]